MLTREYAERASILREFSFFKILGKYDRVEFEKGSELLEYKINNVVY